MQKPTVYLDTSIISALWSDGADIALVARRLRTREWWDLERTQFRLMGSKFVERELSAGLTWNYSHLANPVVQQRLDQLCLSKRLRAPLLVSPESIPQTRFGKSILRRPT